VVSGLDLPGVSLLGIGFDRRALVDQRPVVLLVFVGETRMYGVSKISSKKKKKIKTKTGVTVVFFIRS
jgi:hypothetical protein